MKALVLSGGGARGAYQVGVLRAIAEIANQNRIQSPFKILTGVSAGAINAGFLASSADDFYLATKKLADLWGGLTSDQVFKTDALSLGKIGLQLMGELSFGGMGGPTPGKSLLDTSPLGDLIRNNMDFSLISKHINDGILHSVAITALDYKTSTAVTFVEGAKNHTEWVRARRHSEKVKLQTQHIMASSAIPLLFHPAQVEQRWFGDGCVRNSTPLSPALHLGADQLLVIGVRKQDSIDDNNTDLSMENGKPPSLARIVNVLLNSVLLDGIEMDIERLKRINEFLNRVPEEHHDRLNFKKVDYIWIHPSTDIGKLAAKMSSRLPRVIRYLLKGLGPLDDASEIISYLMFEPEFCSQLIDIGFQDGMRQKDQILEFLKS